MNVAALMCASLLDVFRVTLRHGFAIASLPDSHFLNDGNRLLLFTGAPCLHWHASPLACQKFMTACGTLSYHSATSLDTLLRGAVCMRRDSHTRSDPGA